MIQVYSQGNENYEMNGDVVLNPSSCISHFEINSEWNVQLIHPIDDRSEYIVNGSVLKVPTPYGDLLYEIKNTNKSDYDIQATAYPFFMKAKGRCPMIWDKRIIDGTPQDALDALLEDTDFIGESDITAINNCYFQNMNVIEAINGDVDNSIRNRWGGEIAWINNKVLVQKRLGSDNGARAEFGYNLSGIEEDIDFSDVVTRIYPKAYDGYTLPDHESVDSSMIEKYPEPYPKIYEYQNIKLKEENSTGSDGDILCDTLEDLYAELRKAASNEFDNDVDLPKITYKVDMVELSRLDAYKDYKNLVSVQLGDTVHVKHRRLGIETTQRVLSIDYDCILKKIDSMTLGTDTTGYFDKVGSVTSSYEKVVDVESNTLIADKIKGIINAANASFKAQKNVAQRQDIRAILFEDLDPESATFGALCLGTQGIQISKKRNETNTDWVWGTAINFESIIADCIITGILSDKSGNFYLSMDTGELVMNDGQFKGDLDTKKIIKVGKSIVLSNELDDFYDGNEGLIYVGEDGSNTRILMREATNYPVAGTNTKYISLIAGDVSVSLSDNKTGKRIHLDTADGIMINGKSGLTGTYTVTNSIELTAGFVTGVD